MDMRSLLTLSVLLALIRGNKGQKLTVSLRPKFPQVFVRDDVTLICNREGGSKPTKWFFNGKPQTHQDYLMLITAVTPENNGVYECEQGGMRSEPYTLTVLELEPYAQLSLSAGGAVMTKGDGRNLVLQADDDLKDWACFVLTEVSTFSLGVDVDEKMNRAVIFAELKEAERATFWCKKKKRDLRSNAVTLKKTELMVMLVPPAVPALQGEPVALRCVVWGGAKLEKAVFYKNSIEIKSSPEGTYTITNATQSDNGKYSCHATYRFSHIGAEATQKEGVSDAQELKVIGGPPAAVISASTNSLQCSCPHCPADCTSYHWYHTLFNDSYTRRRLSENDQFITVEEEGQYRCRRECGKGFSRFSNVYSYTGTHTRSVSLRPKFPQVFVGDDVTLICNREGGSKPTKWFFNGKPQTHQDYLMLITAVTPENNGVYECEQGGTRSEPYTLTVLELEPYAQLSLSAGGAVMTKGDGRNLVLQADDDLKDWACFVLTEVSTFSLGVDVDEKMNRAVIFAELKEAERATFWCKKKKRDLRSNAVTLKKTELMVMLVPPAVPALQGEPVALRCVVWGGAKLEKAVFYKNSIEIKSSPEGTYTITNATQSDNGKYSCHATYRFSHIGAEATQKEGVSDAQELKVIGGPPAAVISASTNSLQCSCPHCPADCTSYHWYHTLFNDSYTRRRLSENDQFITVEEEGQYRCRRECGKGFSRFSNVYSYTGTHTRSVSLRPKFPQVFVGDDVTLICNREGGSKPTKWFFNGKPQTHQDYLMLITAVTPENNGVYECEQGGMRSEPYTLTVLELEPYAQLSLSAGGAVMTKGDGRNLVLQADDDLKDWACFVLTEVSTFSLGVDVDEKMNRAVIFAELKEAERATFWCKKKKRDLRSNAVTLKKTELMVMLVPPAVPALQGEPVALRCVVWGGAKLEKAVFYKNSIEIKSSPEGTYTITNATQSDNGKYSCHATYRFSHIGAEATQKEGVSDAQELKVIGGPPAAVISASTNSLQCSCPHCPADCTSYHWYHTLFNDSYTRRRLSENDQFITVEEEGQYRCRRECGKGFSRFSNVYSYTGTHTRSVSLRPKFPQVFVGDDVTLICNREGGSKPTKWFFNGKPQTHQDYLMLITAVTPENNGVYECEQGGMRSEPYTLTVLELEPYAQLSLSAGGAVMTKGDGRNLVLQADDDLKDWACFVLTEVSTFSLGVDVDEKMNRAVIFAELKEAERATFWCKKKKRDLRSNAVTLKKTELMVMLVPPAVPALQGEPVALRCVVWGGAKLEKAVFYKNSIEIKSSPEGTYTITNATQSDNGKYSCHATYRFSHIGAEATQKEGVSDAQELKVIGGPPAAVISASTNSLQCSCPHCPADCTSYHWYHTLFNDSYTRRRLSENDQFITVEEEGQYRCRRECGKGFSRFSNVYSYTGTHTHSVSLRPKFPQVFVGDDVTLICNREGGSKPTKWFFNGKPQTHQDYLMLITAVTPENNGVYECEQGGTRSEPYTLTVLELEPYAQLSLSAGGAVMTKGDGRNLVLQADDDLKDWACFVLTEVSTFSLGVDVDEKMNRAVIFAELKEAERATFWCKKKKRDLRSNAVTLKKTELMVMLVPPAVPALQGEPVALRCVVWGGAKLEKAVFYKNSIEIKSSPEGTYTITNATQSDNGKYSCHATYRFSHIGAEATQKEGVSDAQELKVIGGPPAAVISASTNSLQCSCPHCPADCTSYHWYHTLFNDSYTRRRLSENDQFITVEEEGQYRCRRECGKGFSRFSNVYSYTGTHTRSVSLRPKFPQVFVGDDVTLICNREGGSKPTKWFFNGKPQTHQDYLMLITAVTPENNGVYECEQGGMRSEPYTLTVLELEPYAQLSLSAGGAVMTKGDGRNLVLQADDDLKDWACFVLTEVSTFSLGVDVDEKMNRAVIFAELKEAERATFWCKKKKRDLRSNAVTLKKTELMVMLVPPAVPALQGEPVALRCVVWGGAKLEKAVFYKNSIEIKSSPEGTYTITNATQSDNGKYSCHATYRFSHIGAEATQKEGVSDAQELKVIGGPPAAVISASTNSLQCSCPHCPADCTSYHWYHTLFNDSYTRRRLSENDQFITVEEEGQYRCRRECGKGFSRFSNVYSYTAQSEEFGGLWYILVAGAALILFMIIVLIVVLIVVLKYRRR